MQEKTLVKIQNVGAPCVQVLMLIHWVKI